VKKNGITATVMQHRLNINKSKNALKGKKNSDTPTDFAGTERKHNFTNTMIEMNAINGNLTERSPVLNITRRSISKNPPTLEEAKVPLNSAKRALRKNENSIDSQNPSIYFG
jgi:hypothetical protein